MRKPRLGSTELIRLPLDVARAIRRRAARADLTLAAAARQLLVEKAEGAPLSLPEQISQIRHHLSEKRDELFQLFEDAGVEAEIVDRVILDLDALMESWPGESDPRRGLDPDPAIL
jgi:hypothetical protein